MSKVASVLAAVVVLLSASSTWASTVLAGEYTISTQVTQIESDKFKFEYTIHNNNQQDPTNGFTGLDGFLISLPGTAVISDVTSPVSYHGAPGTWVYIAGPVSALWWGMDPSSVYPIGTDATFSFTADGVSVGQANAQVTTYWASYRPDAGNPVNLDPSNTNAWYSQYDTTVQGPVAVPLPTSLVAGLSLGGMGLVGRIWRRRNA